MYFQPMSIALGQEEVGETHGCSGIDLNLTDVAAPLPRHTTAGRKSAFFRHPSAPGVWSEPSQDEVENCHGRGAGQLDLKLAR